MVTVDDLTNKEIALIRKRSRLMKATEEAGGSIEHRRVTGPGLESVFFIKYHSQEAPGTPISVDVETNQVSVYHPDYFKQAMSFAEMYEAFTKEKFTLKKYYE